MEPVEIEIARGQEKLGRFSEEEARAGLESGRFQADDLAWRPGMAQWRPLSQVLSGEALASEATEAGLPWEPASGEPEGFFHPMLETIKIVLLDPVSAFQRMPKSGGFGRPYTFYVILALIGSAAGYVYQLLAGFPATAAPGEAAPPIAAQSVGMFMGLLIMFAAVTLGIFIWSGILHLCVKLVGGAGDYETTFRVLAYAGGSTSILQVIPICGSVIGGVWNLVLSVIGISKAHEVGYAQSALAVLLPVLVCCGGMVAVWMMLFSAAGAMATYQP